MKFIYFFTLCCLVHLANAQHPIGAEQNSKNKIFELFKSGEYESVLQVLQDSKSPSLYEQYLREMSLLKLGTDDTENLESLVASNSKYPLNSIANYSLGTYYYHEKNLNKANKFLLSIDGSDLSMTDRAQYYFIRGYVYMHKQAYKEANDYFDRADKLNTNNNDKLPYYQGFIAYHLNKKDRALSYFEKAKNDGEFGTSANFFTAKIRLENKKYDEVISLAQSALSDEVSKTNSAFYQLVGESYAAQNKAYKASNYFGKAMEVYPGKPSATLYYQSGVANFKLGLKTKAIEHFIEAGIRSGEYAHLSAYQLARLYLSSNDHEKALSAYIEASASSDLTIKEESIFQAGKLQVDRKNYSEGINFLKDYLKNFPNGKWKEEAQQILAESYLRTSNYDQAISHLKEVRIKTNSQASIYQKVTFQKAQLLFNDGKFDESITWFKESLKYQNDALLVNEAHFSIAESFFNTSDFEEAIKAYKSQKKPVLKSFYGAGYSYYNLNQYDEALALFEQFIKQNPSKRLKEDAELRLADCYYATKQYENALTLYHKSNQKFPSPYLQYQIGLVSKSLGNTTKAIQSFERVLHLEDERLKDDAVFQMAQLKFEGTEFQEAEFYFSMLISKYSASPYAAEAYLNRAISRTNLNKLEDARDDYKYVIDNHLKTEIAFNAVLGLQELESKGVKVKNIQSLIRRYKQANPNDKSLEVIEFEFAKSQYFNLEYSLATSSLKDFISEYPNSSYLIEAKYYLSDAYFRNGELSEAKDNFDAISTVKNDLTGRVLSRLGDINYQLGNYEEARYSYAQLVSLELRVKDTYNGRLELMKTNFANKKYDECLVIADQIISSDWKPLNAERNAFLMKGKSYLELEKEDLATENLKKISYETDLISAESSYSLALLAYKSGDYQQSLDILFDFNSKFGSYSNWIDKSYLLIADTYIEMKELFQAKATLRSIVQHSQNAETRQTAQEKLNAIENQSAGNSTTTKQ